MNVHQLELFYYVAKHGGIAAAVRQMPYGIQQPAVSTQMGNLEQDIGAKLFERTPFRLTPAGERLWAHVQPFFEGFETVRAEIHGVAEAELKICGAELVLRDHLPLVMQRLKKQFPKLRFRLRSTGFQPQIESWLREGEVDVAFVPVQARAPAGLNVTRFAELPLVLQVPRKSPLKTAEQCWPDKKISAPLICLPENTTITRGFLQELKRRGLAYSHVVEATSLDLITRYVANGDGIGVNVLTPEMKKIREVRVLALPGFAPVTMGALWRGKATPLAAAVIEGVREYARTTWPELACTEHP